MKKGVAVLLLVMLVLCSIGLIAGTATADFDSIYYDEFDADWDLVEYTDFTSNYELGEYDEFPLVGNPVKCEGLDDDCDGVDDDCRVGMQIPFI